MAARFDNINDRLLRTATVLNMNAAYTFMGWFYATTLRTSGGAHNALALDEGTDDIDFLQIDNQATHHIAWGQGIAGSYTSRTTTATIAAATWVHFALVRASTTSLQGYVNGVADGAVLTTSVGSRTAATRMELGAWGALNDPFDGRAAYVKAWDRGLSAAEVLNEMRAIRPLHPLNLWGFWPLWPNQRIKDLSGNARDWGESGTLADEDPPPVPYGAPSWLVLVPSAAVAQDTPELYGRPGGLLGERQMRQLLAQ